MGGCFEPLSAHSSKIVRTVIFVIRLMSNHPHQTNHSRILRIAGNAGQYVRRATVGRDKRIVPLTINRGNQ